MKLITISFFACVVAASAQDFAKSLLPTLKAVPGWGWSSPIVWGGKIFVTSAVSEKPLPTPHVGGYPGGHIGAEDPHRWVLYCFDFDTGKILWEFEAHQGIPPQMRHPRNSFASETPVTDGERVNAYFANIGLFCCDMDGKKLWERRWPSYPLPDGLLVDREGRIIGSLVDGGLVGFASAER